MRVSRTIVLVALLLAGCVRQETAVAPEDGATIPATSRPVERVAARWDSDARGAEWTTFVLAALDEVGGPLVAGTPTDMHWYCPKYPTAGRAERAAAWTGLISMLALFESGFKPETSYREDFKDRNGNYVISRGLLQLSIESANGYGCGIHDANELHDPRTNLTCGVRILTRLVDRAGVVATAQAPWRGAAAYWSPFRRADRKAAMRDWLGRQSYCRLG